MKRFLLFFILAISCLSLLAAPAEAKRLGGGMSIGKQRTMSAPVAPKAPTAAPAPAPVAPVTTPVAPPGNRWLGPLAGLAIGAGLGALFAGGGMGGMGGGMGGILMALIAAAGVMFLISLFRKSQAQQPSPAQYAGAGAPYAPQPAPVQQAYRPGQAAAPNIPADFPTEAFLRSAKMSFIRLQAANDRKDVDDIREYTTPEMFAEISMQLRERDNAPQKTDVLSVNAELLEVVNENDHAIASVRMSGQLSENNGPAESFDEIWHVQKNLRDDKSVWLLSGIQQIN
jgi:predicted lipid-binding transport protein (Tim44 family)